MIDPETISQSDTYAIIGILTAIILAALAAWLAAAVYFAGNLKDTEDRETIKRDYALDFDTKGWQRYQSGLGHLLTRIDRFFGFEDEYGATSWFQKPWARAVQLAYVYPLAFLLLGYMAFDTTTMTGVQVFTPDRPLFARVLLAVGFTTYGVFLYLFYSGNWHESWTKTILAHASQISRLAHSTFWQPLLSTVIFVVAVAVALTIAFFVVGVSAGAVVLAIAFAVVGASTGAGTSIAIGIGFGVITFTFFNKPNVVSITLLAFFALFPLANSVMDWASLSLTRRFMRGWVGPDKTVWHSAWAYLIGSIIDSAFAVACMVALSVLFATGFTGANMLISDPAQHIPWMEQMAAFRTDPFGAGFLVTGMLFSTLLPTVFHIGAGLSALTKMPHIGRNRVLTAIDAGPIAPGARLGLGFLMSVQYVVMPVFVLLIFVALFRFAVPVTDWAFWAAEWTWAALGGV